MSKMQLILGIHCHQPVGNFDQVIEDVYQKAYLPFLKTLEQHPRIRFCLHYSGCLIDWLLVKHPEFLDLIGKLVGRGQVEILTGGYYEPILTAIPDWDRLGQIGKLTGFIKKRWDYAAQGLWLAERVWEPHLPETLARAGVDYVLVDDSHLASAGVSETETAGYYLTEEKGQCVRVFPISEKLRYLIPFRLPEETLDYLRNFAAAGTATAVDGQPVATIVDDGEKFGGWPGTHKWVYEEKWLAKFLALLEKNSDWLKTVHPREVLAQQAPLGRVYMPCASYTEMGEWSLPAKQTLVFKQLAKEIEARGEKDRYKPYLSGGFWRNYLAKYPESNHLQKRTLYVSQKIKELKDKFGAKLPEQLLTAENELWQSQCNCPYWHGIFGGLYLPHLRHAAYEHLIRAEKLADEVAAGRPDWFKTETVDLDACGRPEIILNSRQLNLIVAPAFGGALYEIDFKARDFNILDTLARRFEAHHTEITRSQNRSETSHASIHDQCTVKEAGLEKYLVYDRFRRLALMDYLLPADCSWETVAAGHYLQLAEVTAQPCESEVSQNDSQIEVRLVRQASLKMNGQPAVIKITKTIFFYKGKNYWEAEYRLDNLSDKNVTFGWASEFNFSLLAGCSTDRFYQVPGQVLKLKQLASAGEIQGDRIELVDEWDKFKIRLSFSQPAWIWRFPIETIAQSESGLERTYQSSVVMPFWRVDLQAGGGWQVRIRQEFISW